MQITRQADYAVRAVYYLTQLGSDGRAATSKIAKKQHIPASFLAKIVSQLSVAGLLKTSRGARGGVSLARQPKDITLLDVVEAIDGPIRRTPCFIRRDECRCNRRCPIYDSWNAMQNSFAESLEKHTLDSIVCGKEPVHE